MKKQATEDELLTYLDGLDAMTPIREDEFTVEFFGNRRGISNMTARRILTQQVEAGKLTRRQATKNGRPCMAYSLVK